VIRGSNLAALVITCQSGDVAFELIADRLALDFVATVSERGTTNLERLTTPADLADWIDHAGLLDRRLSITDGQLKEAKKLREAIYDMVTAWTRGASPTDRQRRIVNAAAAISPPTAALTRGGRVLRDGDLSSALALLARDAIDLADSADLALVRWCADPFCTRAFVDRSRGHRRRWCGMRGCGDRAKAAAYRRRRRAGFGQL
jgi:predicted RNA-binding Zn ribbon-like protein